MMTMWIVGCLVLAMPILASWNVKTRLFEKINEIAQGFEKELTMFLRTAVGCNFSHHKFIMMSSPVPFFIFTAPFPFFSQFPFSLDLPLSVDPQHRMKISVTRSRLDDFCHISDEQPQVSESEKRVFRLIKASDKSAKIQLIFVDGSKTMKAFKEMYLRDMSVCFQVKNMELFMAKSRMFRHLSLTFLKDLPEKKDDREERYLEIARKFRGDTEKGLQISFRPQIYDGIRTSLICPRKYLAEELPCHRVIRKLSENSKTYEEMSFDAQEEDALRSLVFSGIVVRRSDTFELADWMTNSQKKTKKRSSAKKSVMGNKEHGRCSNEV